MLDEAAWQPVAGGLEVQVRVTPRGGRGAGRRNTFVADAEATRIGALLGVFSRRRGHERNSH